MEELESLNLESIFLGGSDSYPFMKRRRVNSQEEEEEIDDEILFVDDFVDDVQRMEEEEMKERNGELEKIKIVVVGPERGGKTSVAMKFAEREFYYFTMSLPSQIYKRTLRSNDKKVEFTLWDRDYTHRFFMIKSLYYYCACAVIVVFDLTKLETWLEVPHYILDVRQQRGNCPIIVFGNKKDLVSEREVSTKTAQQFCDDHGLHYMEVSAKTHALVKPMIKIYNIIKSLNTCPVLGAIGHDDYQVATDGNIVTQCTH